MVKHRCLGLAWSEAICGRELQYNLNQDPTYSYMILGQEST